MAVVKQALREERAFTRFCREVKTFKVLPDAPDFRFLMRLRGFIENRNTAAEVLEIKGLNPDAEKLRSEFTVFAFSHMHREKLASLLEKFVREPDKITRRYYEQVAELVPMRSLQENVSRMGESISTARSFNHKAAVARGWDGLDFQRLEMLDNRLPRISQSLPAALGEILLHPFVHNLAVLCRRLATDAGSDRAARLVRSIRFLLPRLAGEQLQELERRLLAHRGEWVEQAELDPKAWQRKIEGMGIEDKVILLNGLRLRIQDHPHRGPESHLPDLFGEDFDEFFDEDDDDFPEEAAADDVNLARVLLVLHHDILQDISRPQAKLSPRERKELVGVMEPVLLQDLDFILDQMEDTDEFMSFLNSAIGAGCAGIRMALLAVLAGAHYRHGDLRRRAEKLLEQSATPSVEDIKWLTEEWSEFYYPTARSLKPLLDRFHDDTKLLTAIAIELCGRVEFELFESMVKTRLLRIPSSLAQLIGPPQPKDPGILRRELETLAEYPALDPVRDFLRCYADDRLSLEGHLCWLNALHTRLHEEVWSFAGEDLKRYEMLNSKGEELLPGFFTGVLTDKIEAVLLFMKEHLDDLTMVSTGTLEPLLDKLLLYRSSLLAHHSLLFRLEKVLAERLRAGEEGVRRLMGRVQQTLRDLARAEKRTPKTRKRKR